MLSDEEYCVNIGRDWKSEESEGSVRYCYPVPKEAKGFFFDGFIRRSDSAADFSGWKGLFVRLRRSAQTEVREQSTLLLRVVLERADQKPLEAEIELPVSPKEESWECMVPFCDFPAALVNEQALQFVTAVSLSWSSGEALGNLEISERRVERYERYRESFEAECLLALREEGVYVDIPVRGKAGNPGECICYEGRIYSCMLQPAVVEVRQIYEGWESMKAEITVYRKDAKQPGQEDSDWQTARESKSIQKLVLEPFESLDFCVMVALTNTMVPGGHEVTRLCISARTAWKTVEKIVELKTMCCISHPYLYHNGEGWSEVRAKIEHYPVYRSAFEKYLKTADRWQPQRPEALEVQKKLLSGTQSSHPYCYETKEETNAMSAAYAYMLTGKYIYAEKLAQFFRYFSDEKEGYPARKRGCSQSYVQEGHFFQHLAISYDIICDSGVLAEVEKKAVEGCFRLYMEQLDRHLRSGQISNWLVSEIMGAVYCALALQDWERAERFVFENGGMIEQFRHGIFNDGWWHECSVGYNTWVSSMMIHLAHSLLPFGCNLLHAHFPIPYNKEVSAVYGCEQRPVLSGMYNQKWGGNQKNFVCIKDMFDATMAFVDERGVLFGIADSDEKKLAGVHFGSTYDLAYTYYRDPAYVRVMQCMEPDPIFGHPEIDAVKSVPNFVDSKVDGGKTGPGFLDRVGVVTKNPSEVGADVRAAESAVRRRCGLPENSVSDGGNAYADNIGLMMLRSRTKGRSGLEQIQAVLRYGSHGGAHGHFDITELLSVMRYGRSFFNPENCWWGYAHFMYKFYVQCSLTKNMVVVDDKMQLPADSRRILYESSDRLQSAGVEVTTCWAYPPYGGMVYYQDGQKATKEDLRKRSRLNGCYLPIAEGEGSPVYGEMSDFTEEILQRRVMAVTDDYIVLFDYVMGEQEHVYDSLLQIKGFKGLEGNVKQTGHTEQFCGNILSDGQFITDCSWYEAEGVTKAAFETVFTELQAGEHLHCDRSNYNIPGMLKMDVYTVWPPETEQMVGRVAIYDGWAAAGDGYTVPLAYRVLGKEHQIEKVLAQGSFDGWILGRDEVEVSLEGLESVTLETTQGFRYDESGHEVTTPQCIFWGLVKIQRRDGSWIDLGKLLLEEKEALLPELISENIDPGFGIGKDYKNGRVTIVGTQYDHALPASPTDHGSPGRIQINLKGVEAVRLVTCIGVDAFAGDEQQKRKTYAVRTRGRSARFVTVIEPYESEAKILQAVSMGENAVEVHLTDGRIQQVEITGMVEGDPHVVMKDF